jgi:hypothetical protein
MIFRTLVSVVFYPFSIMSYVFHVVHLLFSSSILCYSCRIRFDLCVFTVSFVYCYSPVEPLPSDSDGVKKKCRIVKVVGLQRIT